MAYYRGPQSPRDEQFNSLSPPQRNPNRWSASMAGTNDARGVLTRRFTTNTVPTLSPIGQQRLQAAGEMQASERAARHYETLLQAQRKIEEELAKVDADTRREVDENLRHEQAVTQLFAQSEPTTPPEYHSVLASNNFSRPNRYSAASLTSPPGIANRPNRSSTQLTSPPMAYARASYAGQSNSNLPSQSVPGSRRQSDDEEEDDDFIYGYENALRRAGANPNRNSMPITSYDRSKRNTTDLVFGHVNTTGFLFDDDKSSTIPKSNQTSPPDTKTYLQVQHTADGFPKLIRREENGDLSVSAVSAALDLASSSPDSDLQHVPERASANRHRISLPPSALSSTVNIAPLNSILANSNENRSAANSRRSMEVKFTAETKRPTLASPPRALANGSQMPQSSYSTNDIPTLKSINGEAQEGGVSLVSPPNQHAALSNTTSPEQNRNAALHRLSSTSNNRQSQEYSATKQDDLQEAYAQAHTGLHANAAPFGPGHDNGPAQGFGSPNMTPFAQPAFYGGYGMNMMANGFNHMNLGGANGFNPQAQGHGQGQWPSQVGGPFPQAGYGGFQQQQQFSQNGQAGPGAGRFDGQRVSAQQRRQAAEDAQAKFNSIKVEQLVGEIYGLCKDQHGCRFLQRKLEERNEQTVKTIFEEVKDHMIELMVDPFGNYLCQKLLESVNDEQRTALIVNAAPAMTKIALNQHGTRALQKIIEYITTPEQTQEIINALRNDVVLLIQDLNGNHVIQKCLNHLSSIDATFIFEAVGNNCIANAYSLVQDPFGNYVVQYILDLSEPCFTEPLCRAFYGEIPSLSRQKFSSNVIEKCIRCASVETRREIVREIMPPQTLEKLLRDGFANYVVQTAMDFADDEMKALMFENVRSILPGIRNTPHGRRIQSKLADYDNRHATQTTSILSPMETAVNQPGAPFSAPHQTPSRANRHGMVGAPTQWGSNGTGFGAGGFDAPAYGGNMYGGESIASPSPQRGNQNSFMFNGAQQPYHNGYGAPGFAGPGAQAYGGHF